MCKTLSWTQISKSKVGKGDGEGEREKILKYKERRRKAKPKKWIHNLNVKFGPKAMNYANFHQGGWCIVIH